MFDFSFENILHSNLINFGVMLAVLAWVISKLELGQKIEQMRFSIEKTVVDSDEIKKRAEDFLADTKKSVENLGEELAEIKDNAEQTAKNISERIMQDAQNQIAKFEENAQKNVITEISKVQDELKKEISEISLNTAKNKIQENLSSNADLHRQLIYESIDKLDKVEF